MVVHSSRTDDFSDYVLSSVRLFVLPAASHSIQHACEKHLHCVPCDLCDTYYVYMRSIFYALIRAVPVVNVFGHGRGSVKKKVATLF